MIAKPTNEEIITRILERIYRRRGLVKITKRQDRQHRLHDNNQQDGHKARLLELEGNSLILTRPFKGAVPIHLQPDEPISTYACIDNTRLSFQSRVLQTMTYPLNMRKQIPVVRISWPTAIRNEQRRDYYRIRTPAADFPQVLVSPLLNLRSCRDAEIAGLFALINRSHPKLNTAIRLPSTQQAIQLNMHNLSGSGIAFAVSDDLLKFIKPHPHLWVRIDLPQAPVPLVSSIRQIHITPQTSEQRVIGYTFEFQHCPARRKPFCEWLYRYTVLQQRHYLKRGRSA